MIKSEYITINIGHLKNDLELMAKDHIKAIPSETSNRILRMRELLSMLEDYKVDEIPQEYPQPHVSVKPAYSGWEPGNVKKVCPECDEYYIGSGASFMCSVCAYEGVED